MRFDKDIPKKYRKSIEQAFQTILEKGDESQRTIAQALLDSKILIGVRPVSEVNASGITGVIKPHETNERIASERLTVEDALGEVFITIAAETIDTGGQQGCEGTLVHEGRHAYDFAQTIASFSDADVNPLSMLNPTLYELEWAAHQTAGDYMLQIASDSYLNEGLGLMVLERDASGKCIVSDGGIKQRLKDSYGLVDGGVMGATVQEMFGLKQK